MSRLLRMVRGLSSVLTLVVEQTMSEQNKQIDSRKIAIVTGGSRGIGRNTVVSPAKRQVDSILTFRTHSEDAP